MPSRTLSKRKAFKGGMHMSHRDFSFKTEEKKTREIPIASPEKVFSYSWKTKNTTT